jgi:hypothetical protein
MVGFLGLKIFLGFEIYFWVGVEKQRQLLVAPPFGLCSGLRQSGSAFRRVILTARLKSGPSGFGPEADGVVFFSRQRQQQIPFGDDNQNGNNNGNSRSPLGMTTRKARATVKARARAVPRRRLFVEFEDFDFDELGDG